MTFFITIAGRGWPAGGRQDREGRAGLGPAQAGTWDAVCQAHRPGRPRAARPPSSATRSAANSLPDAPARASHDDGRDGKDDVSGPDLRIPPGDAPVPSAARQPCPPRIGAVKLTIAETARIERLARQYAAGLITRARLAFHLRWSRWRRCHQARARWHHYSIRLLAAAAT